MRKLTNGPTVPRSGPILLKVAATALNADVTQVHLISTNISQEIIVDFFPYNQIFTH